MRTTAVLVSIVLLAACRSSATAPPVGTTELPASTTTVRPAPTPPATVATTTIPTLPPTTTTTVAVTTTAVAAAALSGISMTTVPADVIVPTSPASLDKVANPINGRRGGPRPAAGAVDCVVDPGDPAPCVAHTLDLLGFDVTSGPSADRDRRIERATAVVQLDAGQPVTGVADEPLEDYLAITTGRTYAAGAREVRQVGTSAEGRPITAYRYGGGPRTVLVVGQTHGDEEGGLRVLLRARTLPVPDGVTLWVIPTMNPDGLVHDTRFLTDGADPNRKAPAEREQQAVYDFALSVRPALSIWYHQNYGWVGGSGASMAPARQYQSLTRLGTLKHSGDCAVGFMWCPIDDAVGGSSILVELPDVLTPADVHAHAEAMLAVAATGGG